MSWPDTGAGYPPAIRFNVKSYRDAGASSTQDDSETLSMDGLFRLSETAKRDPAIDTWLSERAPELGAIARRWFVRMRDCGDDVRETMHDGCPVACVADAAFGYVNVFKAHANVGFYFGAELHDPAGLLEGSGRRMRHVKVRADSELDSTALSSLIVFAYADIKWRLEAEGAAGRITPGQGRNAGRG
jgi:hypothetical protein